MAVDFSEVRVGDLVKLTRGDDEFVQIRVTDVDTTPLHWVQDVRASTHYSDEWDTLEIVKSPLPIKLGSVIEGIRSGTRFTRTAGGWVSTRVPTSSMATYNNTFIENNPHEYEVLFVPED